MDVCVEEKMNQDFLSPLPVFTLESLVTTGQWRDAQSSSRKKINRKVTPDKTKADSAQTNEATKSE